MKEWQLTEIRFSCTGCGKCCNTPPMMTLGEMLRLYEEFPFRLAIMGVGDTIGGIGGFGRSLARRQMSHMSALGAVKVDIPGEESFVMRMIPMPVGTPSARRCEKLSHDGKCTIYDRRPNMCRTVPFDYMLPEVDQDFVFGNSLKSIESGKFECDIGPQAPVVWRDGEFAGGTEIEKSYKAGIKAAETEYGANLLLQKILDGTFGFDSRTIIETVRNGNMVSVPAPMVVAMMLEHPELFGLKGDLPTLSHFLNAQTNLCNRMINANLKRKDARDREVTSQLRDMVRLMNDMRENVFPKYKDLDSHAV